MRLCFCVAEAIMRLAHKTRRSGQPATQTDRREKKILLPLVSFHDSLHFTRPQTTSTMTCSPVRTREWMVVIWDLLIRSGDYYTGYYYY